MTVSPDVVDLTSKSAEIDEPVAVDGAVTGGFEVHLDEFAGPFDVLLGLISKHKLEVTELALSQVTDEFCAHIRAQGSEWDLAEATSFLVVAATLLDLKAARLLPSGEVEDEEDLALLEAREVYQAPGVHREHAEYRDLDAAIHHLRGALTLDVLLRFGRKAASTCPACDAPDGDHALHCPRATEAP